MEEDLLCPFHYFGITDLSLISDEGRSKEEQLKNFRYLTSDERVKYVMEQAAYFGYSGNRVKGLIFCSRIEEAQELSKKFNERGWHTIALSGADSEEVRAEAIERLTMEIQSEEDDYLDYYSGYIFRGNRYCRSKSGDHAASNTISYCIYPAVRSRASQVCWKRICCGS